MRVLLRKSPLCRKHFFEWLKTTVLLFDCGTSTLKSLLLLGSNAPHVHLRLRKRFSRCTLDCGFKTPESPAPRGFVGGPRALATAALYLVLLSNRHISGSSPAVGVKGGANSADACPGCGDDATAPKAAGSGFRGVKLVRLRRGGIRTLGLCFALPKNPGPGVTGAYFPFYTCRRRSIDAAIFAPQKQQIPHQRDGVVLLPSERAACSRNPARPRVRRAYFAVLRALLSRCRSERSAQLLGLCFRLLPRRSEF